MTATSNPTVGNISPDLAGLAVELSTLNPLPGNPRKGDVAAVMRSYEQFGQRKPVVARRSDRAVIAGNHQLQAAHDLGWTHIAVVWTDDDNATSLAYAAATPELTAVPEPAAVLAALLAEVQATGDEALLAATGYGGDDLEKLLRRVEFMAGDGDPDAVPDLPASPVSRPGDLWLLGPHRLLCGDATKPDDHSTLLAGARADMIWTDPPYGVAYQTNLSAAEAKRTHRRTDGLEVQNDALDADALRALLDAAFVLAKAGSRPGAVWFVAAPPGPLHGIFAASLLDLEVLHHTLIWVKDQFAFGRSDYHYRHEPIFYGWTPGGSHQAPPDRTQDSVWEVARPRRSVEHPTMKPVELVARAISNHTNDGDLVLDPFGGSGTTLITANDLGRRAALLELDPRYVDVICRRYQEHTGQTPVLERTGEPHDFTAGV